ncbi:class I SAM-dependent methyltransferase [uncultured Limosilactobacillus sp.]|uniref:class I SAM-dependent methyltransferase n=1 Tax=uncultured Limosilactobacillus sp. TaxID=2837629 RepID=UPI0025F38324|nr:class I SAM-dependent methyltransferase [uncultured Limosilactobacillus sp.]
MGVYQSFASIYDQLFDPAMYDHWANFSQQRVHLPRPAVLDLAGGAGRFASLMAKRGWQMTDLDQSEEMLTLASEHATAANVNLTLVEGDMTQLDGLPTYDVVTCYADSLNYLPTPARVSRTLKEVAAHLSTTGVFLFDVITPYQTDVVYPGYMYNDETDDHQAALMWRSYANDDVDHGVVHDLVIFHLQGNGSYDRQAELHFERSYPLSWWQEQLQAAGFKNIKVTADFGRHQPTATTTRWFFECHQ